MTHDPGLRRRPGWLATVTGLALGLALFGAAGVPGAMAQANEVTVGGGDSVAGASAEDIEALVNSILAEILGGAVVDDGVATDDSASTGGDINVGGNMGGSVTMGGGMGGEISIGEASGGLTVGGSESGG